MKKSKRHAFILLEVLVALALSSLLIIFLWDTYHSLSFQKIRMERSAKEILVRKILHEKLSQLVTRWRIPKERASYSLTGSSDDRYSLFFTWETPLDPHPRLNGTMGGCLHFSPEQRSLELLWLDSNGIPLRSEPLAQHVDEWKYRFFCPSQKKWVDTWEKSSFPLLVRFEISIDRQSLVYTFPILHADPLILSGG